MALSPKEIILHQYPFSPFSEKMRKILAYKKASYRSVEQPMWMPKPNLTPLTGGFRRIPVMQIGADVYCDTALMARRLETIFPQPSLYAAGRRTAAETMASWADRLLFFSVCAPLVFAALGEILPAQLVEDRKKMRPDLDLARLRAVAPQLSAQLATCLDSLESGLQEGDYLLGERFGLADASFYHCLWFVRNDPQSGQAIAGLPRLAAWMKRVEAMGEGSPIPTDPVEALDVARQCEPADVTGPCEGFAAGVRVGVFADDLPTDVIRGEVVRADAREIVLRRTDEKLGTLAVHFPRAGYHVVPA